MGGFYIFTGHSINEPGHRQVLLPRQAIVGALILQPSQTRQKRRIANNLPTASVLTHIGQTPLSVDDQGSHGSDWEGLVDC